MLSLSAFTPLGPVEMECRREPVQGEWIDVAFPASWLRCSSAKPWRNAPIAIGVPVLSVFFSTRPIKSMNLDVEPQVLLHEMLRSSNLVIDDMNVDMIKSQPGKHPVASIIATRKKYLTPILGGLESCGGGRRRSSLPPSPS